MPMRSKSAERRSRGSTPTGAPGPPASGRHAGQCDGELIHDETRHYEYHVGEQRRPQVGDDQVRQNKGTAVLQRRVSDGDARRCLSQQFDSAADNMEECELLRDDAYQTQQQQQQPQQAAAAAQTTAAPQEVPLPAAQTPAEAQAGDFWGRMDQMLDGKINRLAREWTVELNSVAPTLGAEINREREERKAEAQKQQDRLEKVIERLERLEHKDHETPTPPRINEVSYATDLGT